MDRDQAFRLLRWAGFTIEYADRGQWSIGITFPDTPETSLVGHVRDERWIIGFAERFYCAYLELVRQKVVTLLRDAEGTTYAITVPSTYEDEACI